MIKEYGMSWMCGGRNGRMTGTPGGPCCRITLVQNFDLPAAVILCNPCFSSIFFKTFYEKDAFSFAALPILCQRTTQRL